MDEMSLDESELLNRVAEIPGMQTADRGSGKPSITARRSRLAVMLLFLLMGMTLGNWESRIPAIRHAVGVSDAAWGSGYTAAIFGQLASLAVLAVLIRRVKTRRLSLIAAVIILLDTPALAASATLAAVVGGLFVWGFADNMLCTPSNAQALDVERQYGRPLMSTFHATFSVGMLAGGGLGILAASSGVAPGVQMAASNVVLAIALGVSWSWQPVVEPPPSDASAPRRSLRALFTPQLILLAAIAFLIAFTENGSTQWAALYLTQGLGATAALGAAAYTALTLSGFASRLVGDRIMTRFGRTRFLQMACLLAALSLGVALLIGTPSAAIAGFALLGLGTACVYPTVVGLAGNQSALSSTEGIWVMETGQQPGFLLAPVIIGVLASALSLRIALISLVVATASVAMLCSRMRTGQPAGQPVIRSAREDEPSISSASAGDR